MKIFIAAVAALFTFSSFAADPKPAPAAEKTPAAMPMAKPEWKPTKVTKADPKGVEMLYKSMHDAMMKGDAEAAAALCDFPMMMMTDSHAGATHMEMYTKEMWMKEMTPWMQNMPKDMKMDVKTKPMFMSNNMAFVEESKTMTMGKTKDAWKGGALVVMKDGKWMYKGQIEGGWGDMMGKKQAEAPVMAPTTTPAKTTAAK
jgi:hypothetical protein